MRATVVRWRAKLDDNGIGPLETANSGVALGPVPRCFENRLGHNAEAFRATKRPKIYRTDASQGGSRLPNGPLYLYA
jgi:hypothetical protein